MYKHLKFLFCVTIAMSTLNGTFSKSPLFAQPTVHYTGEGANNLWNNPENWDGTGAPEFGTRACIRSNDTDGRFFVVANSLSETGSVDIHGSTLTVNSSLTGSSMTLNSNEQGNARLNVAGIVDLPGGAGIFGIWAKPGSIISLLPGGILRGSLLLDATQGDGNDVALLLNGGLLDLEALTARNANVTLAAGFQVGEATFESTSIGRIHGEHEFSKVRVYRGSELYIDGNIQTPLLEVVTESRLHLNSGFVTTETLMFNSPPTVGAPNQIDQNGGNFVTEDLTIIGASQLEIGENDSVTGQITLQEGAILELRKPAEIETLGVHGGSQFTYVQPAGENSGLGLAGFFSGTNAHLVLNQNGFSGLVWGLRFPGNLQNSVQDWIDDGRITFEGGTQAIGVIYDLAQYGDFAYVGYESVGPVIVSAISFEVSRGSYVSGGLSELSESDNADVSARRSSVDVQSRVFVEVKAVSPLATPTTFDFTLEASVFARTTVHQFLELWNYELGGWEKVSAGDAARFSDSVTISSPTGDLSRFVEDGTHCIMARCRFASPNPRQRFGANIDHAKWTIE